MNANKLILIPLAMLLALTMASCGNDEPDLPRDRDINMTITALTHVRNNSDQSAVIDVKHSNKFVVSQKNLTASMELNVAIDGQERTLSVKDVPLTVVPETSRYAFKQTTTSNPEVTNLQGTIDRLDAVAILQYDIAGHHVSVTIPEVFFSQTITSYDYADDLHSETSGAYWTLRVNNDSHSASVIINDVEIKYNLMRVMIKDTNGNNDHMEWQRKGMFFTAIIGHGANVAATAQGVRISAEQLATVATYGKDQQVAGALETNDYPIRDLVADINLNDGTLQASYTLRHIIARDEDGIPTEWDDMQATTTGNIYKSIILE